MTELKIQDVIRTCKDYIEMKHENSKTLYLDMLSEITVKTYLPIVNKIVILTEILTHTDDSASNPVALFTSTIEMACLFDGLLAYTNINNNLPVDEKAIEAYDVIYQSGLADYILKYCQADYDRLMHMLERTLSVDHLMQITQTMSMVNTDNIQDLIDTMKETKESFNSQDLENMVKLLQLNDPNLSNLQDKMQEAIVKDESNSYNKNN